MNIQLAFPLKFGAHPQGDQLLKFENLQWEDRSVLIWNQTSRFQTEYTLYTKSGHLTNLNFHPSESPYAIAELAEERIYLKYTKYPLPKVTLSKNRNIGTLITFEPEVDWQGTLKFESGQQFLWKPGMQIRDTSSILNLHKMPLVDFHPKFRFLKTRARVHIYELAKNNPQMPYLILMGWFLNLVR